MSRFISLPPLQRPNRLAAQLAGRVQRRAVVRERSDEYDPIMMQWSDCPAVERRADKVSGAWVFKGTRVPVRALFENLEGGARLEEFLEWFPGVTREQAECVLVHAERSLLTQ
jgi:uncharacterized protein (DUF433 family)